MIYYISYVSSAVKTLDDADLLTMLTKFRNNNKANNLTGMLLYLEGTFIQTIEGDKETVNKLYEKIKIDHRHKDIFKILDGYWKTRNFSDWSMAFRSMTKSEAKKIIGYSDISNIALINAENNNKNHPAIKLLQSFYNQLPLHQKLTDRISDN